MGEKALLKQNMKQHWHEYETFLILIAVLELGMMIYGIVFFDFSQLRRQLYFSSYVVLFCCTIVTFVVHRILMRREQWLGAAVRAAYLYSALLIIWSALISALDMTGGGYPVTYMTILPAVGFVMLFSPVVYIVTAVLSSVLMLALVHFAGVSSPPFTFYMNFAIFLFVIAIVQHRNYHLNQEQHALNQKLEEWAGMDALTGISNRRTLDNYIEALNREGRSYTVALMDVDKFKGINDTYGHKEGDLCLIDIAGHLTALFGANVFRYGGDEFAVISFEEPGAVAAKMNTVNSRLAKRDCPYTAKLCSGIYRNDCGQDERKVFDCADTALYAAKQRGSGCAVIYSQDTV